MKECACGPREGEYEYDVSRLNAIWQMVLDKNPFRSIESSFNIIRHLSNFTGVELSNGEILPYSLLGQEITTRERGGATFAYFDGTWQEARSLVVLNNSGWSTIKQTYLGRTTDLGLSQHLEVYKGTRGTWYMEEKIGGDWVYGKVDWTRYHARAK